MSVSGKNIIIDVTEDFAEQTKDEIRTWIQQLQAAMEIVNDQATSPCDKKIVRFSYDDMVE